MGYRLRDRVVLSVFENNKLVSDRAKSKLILNLTHNSKEKIKMELLVMPIMTSQSLKFVNSS